MVSTLLNSCWQWTYSPPIHDPVKSRSENRHSVWMATTALAIMFQTRYSYEHTHSYTTQNIFSVAVS